MTYRALALALCAAPAALAAQELRGTVMQSDGTTPANGVVLVLLQATRDDSVVARTLTTERGTFVIKLPAAATVRLQALRIGFRPQLIGSYSLATGETQSVSVGLSDARVQLATFDVRAKNKCDVKPNGAMLVSQLFEQARTALTASITTTDGEQAVAQFSTFVRNEDRQGRLVGAIERSVSSGSTIRPFTSASAAKLEKTGYIVDSEDGSTLHAPDANVIISEAFVANHCLFLVQGEKEQRNLIGIGFRPARLNSSKVDVHGTLWLDRATVKLQYLEYGYEPLHVDFQRLRVGGRVDYAETSNGLWFVSKWAIRLPRMSAPQSTRMTRFGGATTGQLSVTGIQTVGGEVLDIRLDEQMLYASASALRSGEVRGDAVAVRGSTMREAPVDAASTLFKEIALNLGTTVELSSSAAGPPPVPKVPADERKSLVYVTDVRGYPVPFATVLLNGGTARVTDSIGALVIPSDGGNKLKLIIRRIGFTAFSGEITRASVQEPFHIKLGSIAQSLAAVNVRAKREKTPLERTGFYERMMEVQRGAVVGEFFTPEQLEARPFNKLTLVLGSSRHLHFGHAGQKVVLLGRPTGRAPQGCVMNILLDGHLYNDVIKTDGQIIAIDDIVGGNEVMGVEIYPSVATAPVGVIPMSGDGTCGVVAIWTGGRR